jgi:archaellum component FlaC
MSINYSDPQKTGAEYLERLEKSLTDLRRLHRRCEAHGAVKSAEETLLQIEELEETLEAEHHIYDMVMANR